MTAEVRYLVWTAILTLLIRIPWLIDKVRVRGLGKVTDYPDDSEPLSDWGRRTWIAHEDALQNLILFAVLVTGLQFAGQSNEWTVMAAATFFWARLVHFLVYAAGIPRIKTVAYVAAYAALLVLAWQLILETL